VPVTPGAAVDAAAVPHLGFRYTLALVNQNLGKAEAVDPIAISARASASASKWNPTSPDIFTS
jgi:hypothetical protein